MTFDPPLHVGRPASLDQVVLSSYTDKIHASNRFTNDGPLVREFEEAVALEAGTEHAVAVASGTAALQVLFAASGAPEVYVSAFTFAGVLGMAPEGRVKLADVTPMGNIVPPGYLGDSMVLAQHLWGQLAEEPKLCPHLYYDAAHAMGARRGGRRCGGYGRASALSFHATKIVTSGEGGAIVTNDSGLAQACREIRNFGFERPTTPGVLESAVVRWGQNSKMSEFAAAVGLTSLSDLPRALSMNRQCYEAYKQGLAAAVPEEKATLWPMHEGANLHYVVVIVPNARDFLWKQLTEEGVLARRYFTPLHQIQTRVPRLPDHTPFRCAEVFGATLLCLPTGPTVGPENCLKVAALVARFLEGA